MATLCIYGASDDCVEFEGAIRDEFYVDRDGTWTGTLIAPTGEALKVKAVYGPDEWEVSLGSVPDHASPDWPIHFGERPDREGDPAIFLEVPEGTTVVDDSDPRE